MKPEAEFLAQEPTFWACVRSLSQELGYSKRGGEIIVPTVGEMLSAFEKLELPREALVSGNSNTALAKILSKYFLYRASALRTHIEPRLMRLADAKREYKKLYRGPGRHGCHLPANKQRKEKAGPAYFTCIINMIIERESSGDLKFCDYNPGKLTTFTEDGLPFRTLSRRVDGAFPSTVNPIAIWEIKEYYYTTSFGSRVADGVYEVLLDGLELNEFKNETGKIVRNYLMVDAYETWWGKGKSYLCRIVDLLNMGYIDEVLFGTDVLEELPRIVSEWKSLSKQRGRPGLPEKEPI